MSKPFILAIKCDCNDADYVAETTEVDAKDLQRLESIVDVLKKRKKKFGGVCWETNELVETPPAELYPELSVEEIDWLEDMLPSGENGMGVHTIESIEYYPANQVTRLL